MPWHLSKTSFNVKCNAENSGLLFVCLYTRFGVFGPSFPKLPQCPNTCETSITQALEGLDTRGKANLMWNLKLKTLDYFSCVPVHNLGYLGSVSPNLRQYLGNCETGIIQPTEDLDTSIRCIRCEIRNRRLWISFSVTLYFI